MTRRVGQCFPEHPCPASSTPPGRLRPLNLYDLGAIGLEARKMVAALIEPRHLVAYAVKANTAGSIVRRVAESGAGGDVASQGELDFGGGFGIDCLRNRSGSARDRCAKARTSSASTRSAIRCGRALSLATRARTGSRWRARTTADRCPPKYSSMTAS